VSGFFFLQGFYLSSVLTEKRKEILNIEISEAWEQESFSSNK